MDGPSNLKSWTSSGCRVNDNGFHSHWPNPEDKSLGDLNNTLETLKHCHGMPAKVCDPLFSTSLVLCKALSILSIAYVRPCPTFPYTSI
jgi:hypothetical protein